LAATVKQVVKIPVATIGRIDATVGEFALREGKADFVVMGRPLIADPHLPNKAREGRMADIWRCIYCNACLLPADPAFRDELKRTPLVCTMNPSIGNEEEFVVKPTQSPKRVMVVGGGVAGMEAARVLAERGHQVSLYEQTDKLGGQWNVASQLKGRRPYASLTNSLRRGLRQSGAEIVLGQEVTADFVAQIQPDVVVVATGAVSAPLEVLGGTRRNVVKAEDVLEGKGRLGDKVVVVGGLNPAMEVAYSIASRCKRLSVVLVPELGRKIDMTTHYSLRTKLTELGVYLYPNAAVLEILEDGIWIRYSFGLQYPEPLFLKADTIVQATVGKPESRLLQELRSVMPHVYPIGDCMEPRNAVTAMREGIEIGFRL
jgi:2,4-dienoyl-CoA reductase (NADPH2)